MSALVLKGDVMLVRIVGFRSDRGLVSAFAGLPSEIEKTLFSHHGRGEGGGSGETCDEFPVLLFIAKGLRLGSRKLRGATSNGRHVEGCFAPVQHVSAVWPRRGNVVCRGRERRSSQR